eukprot:symbB.v1.2.014197.t1/scaffold981.1/size258483/8
MVICAYQQVFTIAVNEAFASEPDMRLACLDAGARMLAPGVKAVKPALAKVAAVVLDPGDFRCPACGLSHLSEALAARLVTRLGR